MASSIGAPRSAGDLLLGMDIGTGSAKVALMGIDGALIALEKRDHALSVPREGWAEVPIEDIWRNVVDALRALLANAPGAGARVRGIGVSCLCPGLTPIDEAGRALSPSVIYMDSRSLEETAFIRSRISDEDLFKTTCNQLMPGSTSVTSMLWFKNQRPDIHAKTAVYGHINTFVGKKLTGNFGIDYSNASYSGLFETGGSRTWSRKLIELFGFDGKKLPPAIPGWESVGGLSDKDFIGAGLPAGIPVAMGGGDTACASFAVGILEHNQVFESAGTSNVVTVCSEKPVFDFRFMNRCHVVPGRWLYHGAMSSTGAAVKWLRDEVYRDAGDDNFRKMAASAAAVDPEASCPVFLPYMAGERSPVWDPYARGVLFGLSLHTKRGHISRAVLESVAYGDRQLLDLAEGITGTSIGRVLSIGGWSMVDDWNRIKADATGREIVPLELAEAAVAGAALLGGMASGVYPSFAEAASRVEKTARGSFAPDAAVRGAYDRRYAVYSGLYPSLKGFFRP